RGLGHGWEWNRICLAQRRSVVDPSPGARDRLLLRPRGLAGAAGPARARGADPARVDAAWAAHGADPVQRRAPVSRPISTDLPRRLRRSLQRRVDADSGAVGASRAPTVDLAAL